MDDVIPAADAQIGQSLWAVGYRNLCLVPEYPCSPPTWRLIHPMSQAKVLGFTIDPATGIKYAHLKLNNGWDGFVSADWRTWVAKDPKQTKCRGVSLQIGWSDDMVLRAMKCAPDHINSTMTATGNREQWVYGGGNYLFFENGELVTIQNRN
jgi:hypothetical protein